MHGCMSGACKDSQMTLVSIPSPRTTVLTQLSLPLSRASRGRPHLRNTWPLGLSWDPELNTDPELTEGAALAGGAPKGEEQAPWTPRPGDQTHKQRADDDGMVTLRNVGGPALLTEAPLCHVFCFVCNKFFLSINRKISVKYRDTHLPLNPAPLISPIINILP